MDEARAVEQNVDRPERVSERRDLVAGAHVEPPPVRAEPREGVKVDVRGDDLRAFADERLGRRPADPGARRRQNRDLASQPSRHDRSSSDAGHPASPILGEGNARS